MGCEDETGNGETTLGVAPGLGLGVTPGFGLYKEILDIYQNRHLFTWDGKLMDTVVKIVTSLLIDKGFTNNYNSIVEIGGVYIYPIDYFCPKNYYTGKLFITQNTRSIHHYSATWVKENRTVIEKIKKRLSMFFYRLYGELFTFTNNK